MTVLNIQIIPHHYNSDAEIVIDDGREAWARSHIIHIAEIQSEQDLRGLLHSEPAFIVETIIGMLKEMAQ